MQNTYRELIRSKILGALEVARSTSGITHHGLKGRIREILIADLFRPLLPSDVSIASGQIISCASGRLSRQHDIILFDGSILPPVSFDPSAALIPIESALYTIEIKSRLTRCELESAHASARELSTFDILTGTITVDGREMAAQPAHPNSVLFALSSDLETTPLGEAVRYKEVCGGEPPYLKCLCVAGSGYWYEGDGRSIRLGEQPADDVLAFLGGILNTYKKISATRGRQSIGHYLIGDQKGMTTFPSGTKPTIDITCESCGNPGFAFFNSPTTRIRHWIDDFVAPDPCYKCGGRMIAAAGKYVLRDGLYCLAGDID